MRQTHQSVGRLRVLEEKQLLYLDVNKIHQQNLNPIINQFQFFKIIYNPGYGVIYIHIS